MNALLDYLTVAAVFVLMLAPSAYGHLHERRIDRQLRIAERSGTEAPDRSLHLAA
ncbi:hypothetical protein ACIQNU_13455 [Streptomyces sp. NPDC091292]|uniref:hypothetical protein n=1 Tax=Streptomyces sp. NPDC091292 TaxID=3365991 RepID=UPI0037F2B62A